MNPVSTFDADVAAIRETREQMRLLRKQLELDDAVSLVGPSIERIVKAEEKAEPPVPVREGSRWWDEEMERNWPKGKKRRRWLPWGSRR